MQGPDQLGTVSSLAVSSSSVSILEVTRFSSSSGDSAVDHTSCGTSDSRHPRTDQPSEPFSDSPADASIFCH